MNRVYLGLGSNIGDRLSMLRSACLILSPKLNNISYSSIYETEPQDYTDQGLFLNMVIAADSNLDPESLLIEIKRIENNIGRKITFSKGPRIIDIDILLFQDFIIDTETLKIPHTEMNNREFVLKPLLEINPHITDPVSGKKYAEIAQILPSQGVSLYCQYDTILVT